MSRPTLEVADIVRERATVSGKSTSHTLHGRIARYSMPSCAAAQRHWAVIWISAFAAAISFNSCRNRHSPKCHRATRAQNGWLRAQPNCCPCRTSTLSSPCRTHSPLLYSRTSGCCTICSSAVKALSRIFRGKFCEQLRELFKQDRLHFHGSLEQLASPGAFNHFLWQLSQKDWVVYAKPPFGGAEHVLNYLARYTHRVAISNHRLVAFRNGRVSFRWRDYAHDGKKKIMTVSAHEFLRRFLLHVLPKGLVRIRHFGIFANRRRSAVLQRCRALLDIAPSAHPPEIPRLRCPACSGIMLVVERLTCSQLYFRSNLTRSAPRRSGDDSS